MILLIGLEIHYLKWLENYSNSRQRPHIIKRCPGPESLDIHQRCHFELQSKGFRYWPLLLRHGAVHGVGLSGRKTSVRVLGPLQASVASSQNSFAAQAPPVLWKVGLYSSKQNSFFQRTSWHFWRKASSSGIVKQIRVTTTTFSSSH